MLTAEVIEGFVNTFLKKRFDGPVETPDCHREWWDMCCSPHKFVAIAAPRNHAKSTAITHSYVLANIVFRERTFILLVSDTEAQASFFLNDLKQELIENEDIVKVFGVRGLIKDSQTDFIVEFEDGYQARVIAKGSEQKLRGLKWDQRRPDLLVLDDLENDEIVMNDDRRKKFRDWFSGALIPCKSINGIVRFVGTILHMDSMLMRFMPRERNKENLVTPLCTKGPFKTAWYSAIYKAHTPKFENILWPTRCTRDFLEGERNHFLSQGQPDKYSQEYLNQPIDESMAFFRRTDFRKMVEEDFKKNKIFYIGCDLAVTTATEADYTAFVVGGVDQDGILNIVETIRERIDSVDIVSTILALNKKYDPQYFFFEKGAITNSILPHLQVAQIEQDNFVTTELFARVVDKKQFAHSIQARMRSGRVKFDKDSEWWGDLEQECLRFPRDAKNDQVDALAMLGYGVNKWIDAPTAKELEEEDYLEDFVLSGLDKEGISEWTGY